MFSGIPATSMELLANIDTVILGALGLKSHPTHFTVDQALAVIEELNPRRAFLTHIDHSLAQETTDPRLPSRVTLAYDGLQLQL